MSIDNINSSNGSSSVLKGRPLPHDAEIESAVLGAAFLSKDVFGEITEDLDEKDFYETVHRNIFVSLQDFSNRNPGISVDIVSFKNFLNVTGRLEACGGIGYVSSIMENSPDAVNIGNYIKVIKEYALRRKMIEITQWITSRSYDFSDNIDSILDDSSSRVLELSLRSAGRNSLINIRDFILGYSQTLEDRIENGVSITGIETGFPVIDNKTHGFRPGQLIIVTGRPGTGKTAFALSCIMNMVKKEFVSKTKDEDGKWVEHSHFIKPAFLSYEMGVEEILYRLISNISHVSGSDLITNNIKPGSSEHENVKFAIERLAQRDFFFVEAGGMTIPDIKVQARKMKKDGMDIMFIDYIGLISPENLSSRMQQFEKVAYFSRNLKILARELQIPIVALAQLNREAEKETPTIANIRDSGAIEQDADTVIILNDPLKMRQAEGVPAQQSSGKTGQISQSDEDSGEMHADDSFNLYPEREYEEFYNDASVKRKMKRITAIIAKQRNGETGAGDLCFLEDITTFCNYERITKKKL